MNTIRLINKNKLSIFEKFMAHNTRHKDESKWLNLTILIIVSNKSLPEIVYQRFFKNTRFRGSSMSGI